MYKHSIQRGQQHSYLLNTTENGLRSRGVGVLCWVTDTMTQYLSLIPFVALQMILALVFHVLMAVAVTYQATEITVGGSVYARTSSLVSSARLMLPVSTVQKPRKLTSDNKPQRKTIV